MWRLSSHHRKLRTPRSRSLDTGRASSPPSVPTHTFSTPSTGAMCASRRPSGDTAGASRSGLPNRTSRGMRSTIARRLYPGAAVGRPPYTPAHGSAPDRDVRLRRRRSDRAARVPGQPAARGLRLLRRLLARPLPLRPQARGHDPPLRPRDRHPPGRHRHEARRRRLQRRHLGGAAGAPARVRGAADRRDHARGARRRAGHPQPPRRRDGDAGHRRERPLPGRRAPRSTPASR